MATYTTNWNLLKPESISGVNDDFVDVESQINRNLKIVDDLGWKATQYRAVDSLNSELPSVGNKYGNKIYNHYNGSVLLWSPQVSPHWDTSEICSGDNNWTDIALSAGFENVLATNYKAGYSVTFNGATGAIQTVRLRGRIRQTGYAVWTIGGLFNPGAAGALPGPATNQYFIISTGGPQSRFFRLLIGTNGSFEVRCFGSSAETAGDITNYVDLSGISYSLMA